MKTVEYWVVEESYDRDSKVVGNFSGEATAKLIVDKSKGYRSMHKRVLTIFDSIEDFENNTREKLRERALAKLTTEEKIALGLK